MSGNPQQYSGHDHSRGNHSGRATSAGRRGRYGAGTVGSFRGSRDSIQIPRLTGPFNVLSDQRQPSHYPLTYESGWNDPGPLGRQILFPHLNQGESVYDRPTDDPRTPSQLSQYLPQFPQHPSQPDHVYDRGVSQVPFGNLQNSTASVQADQTPFSFPSVHVDDRLNNHVPPATNVLLSERGRGSVTRPRRVRGQNWTPGRGRSDATPQVPSQPPNSRGITKRLRRRGGRAMHDSFARPQATNIQPDTAKETGVIVDPKTTAEEKSGVIVDPETALPMEADVRVDPATTDQDDFDVVAAAHIAAEKDSGVIVDPEADSVLQAAERIDSTHTPPMPPASPDALVMNTSTNGPSIPLPDVVNMVRSLSQVIEESANAMRQSIRANEAMRQSLERMTAANTSMAEQLSRLVNETTEGNAHTQASVLTADVMRAREIMQLDEETEEEEETDEEDDLTRPGAL